MNDTHQSPMPESLPNAPAADPFHDREMRALEKAIRRIVRASDIQSKALARSAGLTAAQLVVLKGIALLGEVTTNALSAHADLSAATVVTILDNLEERGLIVRYRSTTDRRIVHTRLTVKGAALMAEAPEPLGSAFAERFMGLDAPRRRAMLDAVEQLAALMDGNQSPQAPPAAV